MKKLETEHFLNEAFGWVCKSCEEAEKSTPSVKVQSRLLKEGESESKQPELSTSSLAIWLDFEKRILVCPKCEIRENIQD